MGAPNPRPAVAAVSPRRSEACQAIPCTIAIESIGGLSRQGPARLPAVDLVHEGGDRVGQVERAHTLLEEDLGSEGDGAVGRDPVGEPGQDDDGGVRTAVPY